MSFVPKGWITTEIGKVAEIVTGNTPSRKISEYYGGSIPWVKPPDINKSRKILKTEEYLTSEGAAVARILPKGSVLVTCIGNIGNVSVAETDLATNQQINSIVIKDSNLLTQFVYYQALTWKQWLNENSTATTISLINKSRFSSAPFLLAPLPEQKRIVAKLDTLFGHLDQLKARLEKIPDLLKQFRQAVLTQAVSGKLTHVRPKEWAVIELENLCVKITDGEHLTPPSQSDGVPLLSAKDVRDGYIDFSEPKYVSQTFAEKSWQRCNPEKGDVLVVSRGATVGRSSLIKSNVRFCLMGSVLLFKLKKDEIIPEYLDAFFKCPLGLSTIINMSGATAQQAVYIRDIKLMKVPVPPLEKQKEIVRRIESLFTVADRIEAGYKTLQEKIDQLPQAILSKAFRGELVGNEIETFSMAAEENEKYIVRGMLK